MTQHLDLEEQEQLDQLKHFWATYGNLITWILIAILGSFAGWNGYQYWQRSQAEQAALLYDELDRAVTANDLARVERSWADMQDKFGNTTYAQQAGLLVAKALQTQNKADAAKAALNRVIDKSKDEGLVAVARLRLAGLLVQQQAYDEALKQLSSEMPKGFEPLAQDRRADVLALQGKKAEAVVEYQKAYQALDEQSEYRRLIEVKLTAMGSDPVVAKATGAQGEAK